MLQSFIGPIASLAGTWLQGRVDKAKAETEVKVAKAKAEAEVYKTTFSVALRRLCGLTPAAISITFVQIWM